MMDIARCVIRSGWCFAAWCALVAAGVAAQEFPRTAIIVTAGEAAADWQAVITAEVQAARPATKLVERGELARVWAERERAALTPKPGAAMAVPAVVTVEHYLHFRRVGDGRWIVELVDAESGRALGSYAVDAESPEQAARLVKAAAGLLDAPVTDLAASKRRVAVVEAEGAAADPALFGLAARVRAALADEGLTVLDRALTQELAIEQNDAARGLRAAASATALLGLDYYLEISARDSRLVRVRDAVVLGVREHGGAGADEVNDIQRWALPLLGKRVKASTDYLPQVEIEALEPFYRGLAHYDSGRFPEAVAEFVHAYRINGRFREAYDWSMKAHEALGMSEVAAALRRYLETEFIENHAAGTGRVVPAEGLAFLGLSVPSSLVALRDDLAATAASALAARPGIGLRLPEQLDRLRREFDWMSGDGAEPGRGAAESPGLFTRFALTGSVEAAPEGLVIRWTYRDTLGRLPAETKVMPLPSARAERVGAMRAFLRRWPGRAPRAKREAAEPAHAPVEEPATVEALAAAVRGATGAEIEAARLRLLRAAPFHPLAQATGLVNADEPQGSFMASGWRNHAIRALPAEHVNRRWLEVLRAFEHRRNPSVSRLFDGVEIDFFAELDRLIAARADDGPGLMARYYRLYFQQASLAPEEFITACRGLRSEIETRPDLVAGIAEPFGKHLEALIRLADLTAAAPAQANPVGLEDFNAPTEPLALYWDESGRLGVREPEYRITRLLLGGHPTEAIAPAARSLLFLNAQYPAQRRYERDWLTRFPRSRPLAYHMLRALSNAGRADTLPFAGVDSRAEVERHVRTGIEYIADTVEQGFATLQDAKTLSRHTSLSAGLIAVAANDRISEFYTAEEHEVLRSRLIRAERAAQERLPFNVVGNTRTLKIDELTHGRIRAGWQDYLDDNHIWMVRENTVRSELAAAERMFATAKPTAAQITRWWWLVLRWEAERVLPAPERARMIASHVDAVLGFTPDPLSDRDAARLFDLGLILLYGREDEAAERVFARIGKMDMPAGGSRLRRELLANTRIRLAQLHRAAGRVPEALAEAAEGLRVVAGEDLRYFYNSHDYSHNEGGLGAHLSRLVVELRHHRPSPGSLPERVGVVSVPTPDGANPLLHVYYRRPPAGWGRAAAKPVRVLVLAPVHNAEALDYVAPESEWARFADEQGLLLVVPRFVTADLIFRLDHRFTHHRFAQAWSGDAVLRAIDEIGKTVPLEAGRLLVHGQASGSGFASHFTATYPGRVSALSVLNGNWGLARLALPKHAPLGEALAVHYWVGGNPLDNHHVPGSSPRFVQVADYAARLKQAGATLEWTEWPARDHTPLPEAEAAARAFLARQLSP
jgi:hypothetical protein